PLQAESKAGEHSRKATARSVILLFQFGGPSHLDSFDPKPDAPREIRGEFGVIPTNVPGIRVTEHLPRLARCADKYALVRSVSHHRSRHNPGAYHSLTCRAPLFGRLPLNASAIVFRLPGSIVVALEQLHPHAVPLVLCA